MLFLEEGDGGRRVVYGAIVKNCESSCQENILNILNKKCEKIMIVEALENPSFPPPLSSKKSIWRKGVTRSYSIVKTYHQHF
jgi:hypothetical protein